MARTTSDPFSEVVRPEGRVLGVEGRGGRVGESEPGDTSPTQRVVRDCVPDSQTYRKEDRLE